MALNAAMLVVLCDALKPGQAIASMGYPDIAADPKIVSAILGDRLPGLKYRDDSDEICRRHGIAKRPIPDAESLFELLGASLDVYDITDERGCEIVLDLNYPIHESAHCQYDHVLDIGTMEHCFNAPAALMNMANMAKVGGRVYHDNPFNWGNHGFWGVNPTLFTDFYESNGFRIESCYLTPKKSDEMWDAPRTARFVYTEKEANIFTVAERAEIVPFSFPTQTKYRK